MSCVSEGEQVNLMRPYYGSRFACDSCRLENIMSLTGLQLAYNLVAMVGGGGRAFYAQTIYISLVSANHGKSTHIVTV